MDISITLLGISNSGKTNFIAEVVKDINSFSPKITIKPAVSTQTAEMDCFCNNLYVLNISESLNLELSICDYDGKLLNSQGNNQQDLKNVLYSSNTWIILIDGTYFTCEDESIEKIIRKVKRSSARVLCPYISEYAEEHNETAPELLFAVTKANGLTGRFTPERVKYIVMAAFEGIFSENASPMILLCDTACTKAAGLAVLSFCYLKRKKEVLDGMIQLENCNERMKNKINELQHLICEIENQKILGKLPANKRKTENFQKQIDSLKTEISNNDSRMEQYKTDTGLKYLGTCVRCWIDNNTDLAVNGFDKIDYQYDKSAVKIVKRSVWVKVVLGFDLCMMGGAYGLAISGMFSINERLWGIACAVWFSLSVISAMILDKRRKKNFELRFQDDLVNFFYTMAKEKNNGELTLEPVGKNRLFFCCLIRQSMPPEMQQDK